MPVWDRLVGLVEPAILLSVVSICVYALLTPVSTLAQEVGGDVFIPTDAGSRTKLYQKSYALVIGIDDYQSGWPKLRNAVADADSIAKALAIQGFEVSLKTNLSGAALRDAFDSWFLFAGLQEGARLLVWFAGHGQTVSPAGTYLIPTDVPNPTNATET
jgi:hypothetical protein